MRQGSIRSRMIDIHSHILFGIDDGARDAGESRDMLAAARAADVDHIVATPHVRRPNYDLELARQRRAAVADMAAAYGVRVDLGFELNWNALITLEETEYASFCFEGTKRLLLEFSLAQRELPIEHDQMIYRLQRCGFEIIIAHPERYRFVQSDFSIAERWRDMGCALQIDAICLLRAYEPRSKITAKRLYKAGLYDYLASDAHCAADYARFGRAITWAKRHE